MRGSILQRIRKLESAPFPPDVVRNARRRWAEEGSLPANTRLANSVRDWSLLVQALRNTVPSPINGTNGTPVHEPFIPPYGWERWRPHETQYDMWAVATGSGEPRFRVLVVVAGRRSGKTAGVKRIAIIKALCATQPGWRGVCAAPTQAMARRIWFNDLQQMIPRQELDRVVASENAFVFRNGARLECVGADVPERLVGSPIDFCVLDEYSTMGRSSDVWTTWIRPGLSTPGRTPGQAIVISTPRGRGHLFQLFRQAQRDTSGTIRAFHWTSEGVMPEEELKALRADLDERTYAEQVRADFLSFESRAYWQFNRDQNCVGPDEYPYDPRETLRLGLDFGHKPGVMEIAQDFVKATPLVNDDGNPVLDVEGRQIVDTETVTVWIDEIWRERDSNTPLICNEFLSRYRNHLGDVVAYGDAAGGAKSSSQVLGSDWDLVDRIIGGHFGDRFSKDIPKRNPLQKVRLTATNSRFRSTDGTVRMLVVDERCPHLVDDFEGVELLDDGSISKKDPMLTHASDGASYLCATRWGAQSFFVEHDLHGNVVSESGGGYE